MRNPRRILAVVALLALTSWLPSATADMQGDKKIEMMKEAGVFTADTPKDKVKMECPSKLYTLECVAGRTYTIFMRSDEFDAFLRLEDPNGKTIKEDDDSGEGTNKTDARIIFKADKAGTYNIAATSFGPGAKGKYTILVLHDGVGADQDIKYLLDKKDKLTKDDPKDKDRGDSCHFKSYKVELNPKTTYIIQLDSRDFDAYLRLLNPDGKEVASDDDGAKDGLNAKIVYNCTAPGRYTIIATSFGPPADTGEFHLRVHEKK